MNSLNSNSRTIAIYIKNYPGDDHVAKTPNKMFLQELMGIFQGLYDTNPQIAEALLAKYPKGAHILQYLPNPEG